MCAHFNSWEQYKLHANVNIAYFKHAYLEKEFSSSSGCEAHSQSTTMLILQQPGYFVLFTVLSSCTGR